jgi:hypothetical protein
MKTVIWQRCFPGLGLKIDVSKKKKEFRCKIMLRKKKFVPHLNFLLRELHNNDYQPVVRSLYLRDPRLNLYGATDPRLNLSVATDPRAVDPLPKTITHIFIKHNRL